MIYRLICVTQFGHILDGISFFFFNSLLKNYGFVLPECKAIRIQEQNITASQLSISVLCSFLSGPRCLHDPQGKGVIQAISCVSANCPQNASHLLLCNVILTRFYFFMNQGFPFIFCQSTQSEEHWLLWSDTYYVKSKL